MKKFFKWAGIVLGSLLGLVLIGLVLAYFGTEARINDRMKVEVKTIPFYSDSLTIAEGRYLGTAITKCVECHGENLGGKVFIESPVGTLVAPNLTSGPGSLTKGYTDADWVRAIRNGLDPDGRPLWVMPADEFQHLSATEINAVVSWVKSMPPVSYADTTRQLTLLGRVLVALDQLPLFPADRVDHSAPLPVAPTPGPTVEYGRHMALTGGCVGCHGPGYSGGVIPGTPPEWPPAKNITFDTKTGIGSWSEADFYRAMREGRRPDGKAIDTIMPWRLTRYMKDVDLKALYVYLKTVPPKTYGGR